MTTLHAWLVRLWAGAVVACLLALPAAAERVALIIGNGAYAHVPRLDNPGNDAADMAQRLEALGFHVTLEEDLDFNAMLGALQAFRRAAVGAEQAMVFFAGHGIEVDGRNWLVPVDARLASADDTEFEAIPLDLVLRAVSSSSGLQMVILDACRENPFANRMQRTGATRSVGRGLGRVSPPSDNTLIAYAAREGTVAADGTGQRNSPYTRALLDALEEPGVEVGLLFRRVRDRVMAATGGVQEPNVYQSLGETAFYIHPPATAPPAPAPAPQTDTRPPQPADRCAEARALWPDVRDIGTKAVLRDFVETYGDCPVIGTMAAELLAGQDAARAAG
ncbi:MAG: caspase family protein, partial [Rhodobacteraceae bacterium]|nr:caspase family protein [Paracoccaceae bacterium]